MRKLFMGVFLLATAFFLFGMKQSRQQTFIIRPGALADCEQLRMLYKVAAEQPGGLARTVDEITDGFIQKSVESALGRGLIFVAEENGQLIGCMHKFAPEVKAFSHMLSEGSLAVHPGFHRNGVGLALLEKFLQTVVESRPDIKLVKLIVRESNIPAIKLYQRVGFEIRARLEDHIQSANGFLENDLIMMWVNPNYKSPSFQSKL